MKKSLWTLGIGFLAAGFLALAGWQHSPVKAADPVKSAAPAAVSEEGLVKAEPASSVDITIYGGRFAQVEETRRVHLKPGSNRILLNGIAAQYRADSLRVVGAKLVKTNVLNPKTADKKMGGAQAFTYLSATYQPANLTPDKILAGSVGKRVTFRTASGSSTTEVSGFLLSVNGGSAVVQLDDGKTSIVPVYNATVDSAPRGLSNSAALVLEAWADVEGDYDLNFLYDTNGITWNAKHSLIYNDEKSVVESWESSVGIQNNSGTSFEKATVRLLAGKVADAQQGEGRMYRSAPGGMAPANMANDASVESVGEQKSYTLPGEINLVDGQSRQVPLFRSNDVPVKREYFVSGDSYYGRAAKQEVGVRLEVDNCEKKNLGKALPGGIVKIYQRNSAGRLQLTGGTQLGDKAVDEVFQMVIGTSSDIKWERMLVDRKDAVAPSGGGSKTTNPRARVIGQQEAEEVWEAHTYKFVVYNFKRDRAVDVVIEMSYPTDQKIGNPWQLKPSIDQAHTTVSVPKSDKAEVSYTVVQRVR